MHTMPLPSIHLLTLSLGLLPLPQVHVPAGLAMLELDLIRLTAQYVARNGKEFLSGLMSRENSNPQFGFLKPTHSLFSFFTAMADAYSKVRP
jgi:splicing factor 3A subunit 1